MGIHNAADNSFKLIFSDHRLFSEFIRDFIHIDILKDLRPENIEDLSERFIPLTRNSRDSDTVKRIKLKNAPPFFVIAILEHESQVNFRSSFKMLEYIFLVLDAWEKEAEKEAPGASRRKNFKYPPVLPIVFYDGKHNWTAEKNFFDRTFLNKAFEKYIPKFEYELIDLKDYSKDDIMGFGDALSYIMLIDKFRNTREKTFSQYLPMDYIEKLKLHIPSNLNKLLVDVSVCLVEAGGYNRFDAKQVADLMKLANKKEYDGMFEAAIESIQEGQQRALKRGRKEGHKEGREEGLEIGREEGYKEKLQTAANLKKLGVSVDIIAQATGLSVDEIEKL